MNTQDYDNDGNNIVPCPICLSKYCPSKDNGKCPEEDEFAKAMTTPHKEKCKKIIINHDTAGNPVYGLECYCGTTCQHIDLTQTHKENEEIAEICLDGQISEHLTNKLIRKFTEQKLSTLQDIKKWAEERNKECYVVEYRIAMQDLLSRIEEQEKLINKE